MTTEIIFAGFGGQGVILAGKILTLAGMSEDKFVSHIPSYGAEMRGGTANCSVIVSDEEVASPVIENPDVVVALNKPSMTKFEPLLKKGGLLIYNSSLIDIEPTRSDIRTLAGARPPLYRSWVCSYRFLLVSRLSCTSSMFFWYMISS